MIRKRRRAEDGASTVLPGEGGAWTRLLDRIVTGRAARRPRPVLLALGLLAAALHLLPGVGVAPLAPLVLVAVLGPMWAGRPTTTACLLVGLAGAQDLPPRPYPVAGSLLTLAALLAVGQLVSHCADRSLRAQATSLRERAVRDDALREAQARQFELTGQLQHGTTHDPLTGLLNRSSAGRLLEQSLEQYGAAGVLVAEVAGFTAVNDVLGDDLGDEALTLIGRRLAGAARDTDSVARLEGDRFAVLLPGLRGDGADRVGERLAELLRSPLTLGSHVLPLHCRTGLAVADDGSSTTGRALLRAAESAARAAEAGGPVARHGDGRGVSTADLLRDEADLARGLAAGEFFLLYQPLVSTATGQVASAEALVRWRHPQRGLVPPDAFIGLSEATGLIVPLGLRVLEMAVGQLRQWAARAPSLTVAVNVSARQLVEPTFVEDVRRILWGSGVDPSRVVLELTESLLVDDSEAAVAVLWQLRGLGVRLALDDFGTGYSSLARLGEMPLDEMKIDKSFVDRLGVQPRDSASLVTAAVAMGHGLGLEVVAEGVETAAQAQFLRGVGCDLLQGYLLGRPLPPEELEVLLGQPLLPTVDDIPGPREQDPVERRLFVPGVMPSLSPPRG